MEDVPVLDGEWELYQSGDWTQHATNQSIIRWGIFWLLVPCMRKLHTRPALTWTAVVDHHLGSMLGPVT